MTEVLEGRAVLVTGGSRGIGAAIVRACAEAGADVAFTYQHSTEQANTLAEKLRADGARVCAISADSGDPDAVVAAVDTTVAEFGRLDVLVNNAAVFLTGPLEDMQSADVDRTLQVNVRAPLIAAQAAAHHMGEGGRIITIGSNVIENTPFPGMTLYALSKSALVGMTKGLSRDLGPRGITVNLVSPGPIDTDLNPASGPQAETINALVPRGRFGTAAEVADTVLHLARDSSRNINGANVAVDGGITA